MNIARLLAIVVVLASSSAHAADYWVGPPAEDAPPDGSMAHPWPTIVDADNVVGPGDVVHVLPGDYEGSFQTYASGTEGAPIVFVAEETWMARLVATDGSWIARGDWVDIIGFEYTGDAHVGLLALGSHVRYVDNWVHHLNPLCNGNGGAGIDAGNYEATEVDMIGNVVHDIWALDEDGLPCNRVQGLYHAIPGGTIANNITWNISGFGIHMWHNPRDLVITNNLVFATGRGGIVVGADINNGGFADGFLVANNIVGHTPIGILEFGETGLDNRYIANMMFEVDEHFRLLNGLEDEGTIVVDDPQFVDFQLDGSGDYHLAEGSPAIDAGIQEGAPATDMDGVPRPQGEGIDIGPYEVPVDVGTTGDGESSTGGGSGDESSGGDPDEGSSASVGDETPDPTTGSDVSTETSGSDGGQDDDDDDASGCGCSSQAPAGGWALLLLGLALRRRRAA